jgi:hypothetical protein
MVEQSAYRTEHGKVRIGTVQTLNGYPHVVHRVIRRIKPRLIGWTKDYTAMLTLVINGMTGLIAALVIASVIQSARAFIPAWKNCMQRSSGLNREASFTPRCAR